MKRLLVVFLALAVTTGAFAQITVNGQMHTHFGIRLHGGDAISVRDGNFQAIEEGDRGAEWDFRFLTTQTHFTLNAAGENVGGFLRFRANGSWRAFVWGDVGDHQFGLGFIELPWVQWSPISFDGDSNWGIGAAASTVDPYFVGRFNVAPGMQVYVGLTEAGILGRRSDSANRPDNFDAQNGARLSHDDSYTHILPGFFLGFEMTETDYVAGLAFAGLPTSTLDGQDNIFSWMVSAYGRLFNIGPTGQIGLNVAVYGDPAFGFFAITESDNFGHIARGFGTGWTVLEGMVNATFPLDFGTVALSYGILLPFDSDSEAVGQQAALQATIPFGNGFSLIPGVRFRHDTDHLGNARSQTDIGLHMRFNF